MFFIQFQNYTRQKRKWRPILSTFTEFFDPFDDLRLKKCFFKTIKYLSEHLHFIPNSNSRSTEILFTVILMIYTMRTSCYIWYCYKLNRTGTLLVETGITLVITVRTSTVLKSFTRLKNERTHSKTIKNRVVFRRSGTNCFKKFKKRVLGHIIADEP